MIDGAALVRTSPAGFIIAIDGKIMFISAHEIRSIEAEKKIDRRSMPALDYGAVKLLEGMMKQLAKWARRNAGTACKDLGSGYRSVHPGSVRCEHSTG